MLLRHKQTEKQMKGLFKDITCNGRFTKNREPESDFGIVTFVVKDGHIFQIRL